jgi:ribonuclease P protein component
MDQRAGKTRRVTTRSDIDRIFASGRRVRDRCVTLAGVPNGLSRSRCAVGVSKRHGIAVRRNRIKRLCREAFRLSRGELAAGWDYMIMPRPGGRPTLAELRQSLVALARRLAERHEDRERER